MKNYLRRTKIIATAGPSIQNPAILKRIILSGVNIFRLNFSHSSHEEHLEIINLIREISKSLGKEVGILGDLQGPKIRLANLQQEIATKKGDRITITTDQTVTGDNIVHTTYENFAQDVKIGNRILIDDGAIELLVAEIKNDRSVSCEVIYGGILKSRKGLNLPDSKLSVGSFTDKDVADLSFIIKHGLDFVALSFVRSAQNIEEFYEIMHNLKSDIPIIAKIEKPEAIKNVEDIINASYGIMIARGDLGVEIPAEQVPFEQKRIAKLCNKLGKPVIIATQILESMITKAVPTRAEANDIANAVLDGADALMLSAETASGLNPIRSVNTMGRIIEAVEQQFMQNNRHETYSDDKCYYTDSTSDAVCYSAVNMSINLQAKLISCVTKAGNTALNLARHRPPIPILAITDNHKTSRKLILSWGVFAITVPVIDNTIECMNIVIRKIDNHNILKKKDLFVFTVGLPHFASDSINTIKVYITTKDDSVSFM